MKIAKRVCIFLFAASIALILLPVVLSAVMLAWLVYLPGFAATYVPKKELAKLDDEYL